MENELEDDEIKLHNTLKAKLTKKEFRLFAMVNANVSDNDIKERFKLDDEELKKAKDFYYKSYQIGKNSNTNFSITGLAARSYNRLNNDSQISPKKKANSIPNSP